MDSIFKVGGDHDFFRDHVSPVAANAGDVVLFSEATIHGALAWTNQTQERLIALYRFASANFAYARGYLSMLNESQLNKFTPRERAVVQPPFNLSFERKILDETVEGQSSAVTVPRSEEKKDFDRSVFGKEFY